MYVCISQFPSDVRDGDTDGETGEELEVLWSLIDNRSTFFILKMYLEAIINITLNILEK